MGGYKWKDHEIEYLKKNYKNTDTDTLIKELYKLNAEHNFYPDRHRIPISNKANQLGLKKNTTLKVKKQITRENLHKKMDNYKRFKKEERNKELSILPEYIINRRLSQNNDKLWFNH